MNRQFPHEIIQLIVEASVNSYDIFLPLAKVFRTRYAILRSFSLLNSTWYGASQPELIKAVVFLAEESAAMFLEMAARRGGAMEGVRDLYVSPDRDGDSSTLPKLLKATPHLINLCCYGGTMDFGDLAHLQRLRRLQLVSVHVTGSPSSSLLCLPHLQRLCITSSSLRASATHFLTPAFLPQLRRIDTVDSPSIAPLIQQLEIVTFEAGYGDYTLFSRAQSLLLLPLPLYSHHRLPMLSNLPSLPPFLHIYYPYADRLDDVVALALEKVLEAKKPGLRIILLNDHGFGDSIMSLIQRLQERGIRVQMVDKGLDLDGAIEEMYRIRAKEQRAKEDEAGQGV